MKIAMKLVILGLATLVVTIAANALEVYNPLSLSRDLKATEAKLKPITTVPSSVVDSAYGPGDYERSIEVAGLQRRYELHVPPQYQKDRSWPVVFNFHGGGGRGAVQRLASQMDLTADKRGFIVVYPDGTGRLGKRLLTWNAGICCGYAKNHHIDDVGFTRAMINDLASIFHIDPKRIYATGLSNGALMTYRLACELSDKIAAAAPVAGVLGVTNCQPKRPVSIIHFHGLADKNDPYQGGVGEYSVEKVNFMPVRTCIQKWIALDRCNPSPVKSEKRGPAIIETWQAADGTEVVLVTFEGLGHGWPSGRQILSSKIEGDIRVGGIDVNDMMWEFFRRHPMR